MFRRRSVVRVFLASMLSALTTFGAQITISPQMGSVYPDDRNAPPYAIARINSEFELRSVTSTLSTQTLSLAFFPPGNEWHAAEAFDISNTPSGTNVVRFLATDVFGNSAETNHVIVIDRVPVIEVLSPAEGALARPILFSTAAASDDRGTPSIHVLSGLNPPTLFHQRTTFAEFIMDLSPAEESVATVNFFAHDATRFGYSYETRRLLSLSNPRYQPVLSLPGEILDANADAVLYLSRSNELTLVDRRTSQNTVLATNFFSSNLLFRGERLTPTGALVVNSAGHVLDFNRGEEIDLGAFCCFSVFAVNGRFGLINADGQTFLRNFDARTNYIFPFIAAVGSVAENGTAVLADPAIPNAADGNAVYRFADGQLTQLTDTNEFRFNPLTDGTNVLWIELESYFPSYRIHLLTPLGLTTLATNLTALTGTATAMNDGWVAFPKVGAQGQQQIWLRSPAGEVSQATFYSRNSEIKELLPDGSLLAFVEGTGIVYIPLGQAPKRISSDFGARNFLTGTNFLASRLGHLFDLLVQGDPIGLTSPQYDPGAGVLTYYVTSSQPATFTLQRSTNLVDWTDVTPGAVTNTLPTKFQVETTPGIFRLHKE